MTERKEAVRYVIGATDKFPKRWRDHHGPIRVMTEPIEGYVMVRRPRAVPFVLSVAQLLNAEGHPVHGPFEIVGRPAPTGEGP